MCVIIYKPEGMVIEKETVRNYWVVNNDGAGYGIYDNKNLFFRKGIMSLKELEEEIDKLNKKHRKSRIVLHLRAVSKGKECKEMTHPFSLTPRQNTSLEGISKNPLLFHNGTITSLGDNEKSDTYQLAELLGKIWNKTKDKDLIKDCLKILNQRFVVMYTDGDILLINMIKDDDGCYYSIQRNLFRSYYYNTYNIWQGNTYWNKNNNYDNELFGGRRRKNDKFE